MMRSLPGGGVLPYSLGGGVPLVFAKVLPFTRENFANFVSLYQSTLSIFCYSNFCPLSDENRVAMVTNDTLDAKFFRNFFLQ